MGVLSGVLRGRLRRGQHRRGAVHAAQALKPNAALAGFLLAAAALLGHGVLHAQSPSPEPPASAADTDTRPELASVLPRNQLIGKGRLTFIGFQVYDARLWAQPGFTSANYASQPLALELAYLRGFEAVDVAKRSMHEIKRSLAITPVQEAAWTAEMLRVLPDVKKGDRITGVYQPGVGASFLFNGKPHGDIRDPEFARLFFGIWLSPATSEPQLRAALLGNGRG